MVGARIETGGKELDDAIADRDGDFSLDSTNVGQSVRRTSHRAVRTACGRRVEASRIDR
jgi:hypothetical protein